MFHPPSRSFQEAGLLYFSIPPVRDRGIHEKTGSRFREPVLKKGEVLNAQIERPVHHPGRFLNV